MFLRRRLPRRWSNVAGSYSPNAFAIRLPADTAVIDPASLQLVQNDPEAVAVLIHEYWHYLQNLTTVAGFMSLLLQQDFARAFSETLVAAGDGTSVGSDAVGGHLPDQVEELTAILDAREGGLTVPNIDEGEVESFRVTGVHEDDYTLTRNGQPVPLRRVVLDVEAEMSDGSTQTGHLLFGQACVEEGVAYLVDRMVAANGVGAAAAENSPPFPYWVLRELALTGSPVDLTAIEIASLGTLSLLTPDPAGNFLALRDDYAGARAAGRSIREALGGVWQQLRPGVEQFVGVIVQHELPGLRAMHRGRGLMESAAEWLARQYTTALEQRLRDPLFDLEPFAHNRLDRAALSRLLRTVLPCDVILGRTGDPHAVERDLIVAFGVPGLTANGYGLSDILRTLESQVNFVLSHLGADSFLPSADVEQDRMTLPDDEVPPCPFYSACGLQLRRDNAATCFRRPWRIFDAGRGANCWYGTAVACTLGPVRVNNVIRDPRELEEEHRRIVRAVERRAYEIWEERGREGDNDWAHWFQARRELGIPDDYHV
jgi:hypothetical protein